MRPPEPINIPPSPIALFPAKAKKQIEEICLSYNREAWVHNREMQKRLSNLDANVAEKKLRVVDEELGEAILRGTIKLTDQAMTTPVKMALKEEEERVVASPSDITVKPEYVLRMEHRLTLCRALRKGQVNCMGCLLGTGCEWDGPMGELLRAHAALVRARRPSISSNQIRFGLYRSYVNKRFEVELEQLKEDGDDDTRIPLPLCVESEIKKKYNDGGIYVGFKKRNAKKEE
jgi:hypothetical protein